MNYNAEYRMSIMEMYHGMSFWRNDECGIICISRDKSINQYESLKENG